MGFSRFAAGGILLQATALGLPYHFRTALTASERATVQAQAHIPADDAPDAVVSIGSPRAHAGGTVALPWLGRP